MWRFEEPDYIEIIEYTASHMNFDYVIPLLEQEKYKWSIAISRCNDNISFPWIFMISIQDEFKLFKSLCDFEITKTFDCHIINIDSCQKGHGTILFSIMKNLLDATEYKINNQIASITGDLENIHKVNKNWLTSIPFYCMKAYQYSYSITFSPCSDKCKFIKTNSFHDTQYHEALTFAKQYLDTYDNGQFTIFRY